MSTHEPAVKIEPAPQFFEAPDFESLSQQIIPLPPMTDSTPDDSFADIGRDAALEQLKATRRIVASEAFQERLVPKIDAVVDVPYMPDALEAKTIDMAYDLVQKPAVNAIDELIETLK